MNPPYAIGALSSVLWGVADFTGGLAAKRAPAPLVTCFSGLAALAVLCIGMPLIPGAPTPVDLAWGGAAGACGALGASLMYRSLALGPMSLASPVFSLIGLSVGVALAVGVPDRGPPRAAGAGVGARLAGAGHHRAHRAGGARRALDGGAGDGAPGGARGGRVHLGRMTRA